MLQRSLLWLACRHHIPELFIKHANTAIRGPSKDTDDPLFKEFKAFFGFINLDNRTVWKWPTSVCDWRHQRAGDILVWADRHTKGNMATRRLQRVVGIGGFVSGRFGACMMDRLSTLMFRSENQEQFTELGLWPPVCTC